jgi:hypothetical protein
MTENELHGVADGVEIQFGAQLGAFRGKYTQNMSSGWLVAIVSGIPRVGRKSDAVGRHQAVVRLKPVRKRPKARNYKTIASPFSK